MTRANAFFSLVPSSVGSSVWPWGPRLTQGVVPTFPVATFPEQHALLGETHKEDTASKYDCTHNRYSIL